MMTQRHKPTTLARIARMELAPNRLYANIWRKFDRRRNPPEFFWAEIENHVPEGDQGWGGALMRVHTETSPQFHTLIEAEDWVYNRMNSY